MKKDHTNQYLPITEMINPIELLDTIQLMTNGLITEDEFLIAVGFDVPVVTSCIFTANSHVSRIISEDRLLLEYPS